MPSASRPPNASEPAAAFEAKTAWLGVDRGLQVGLSWLNSVPAVPGPDPISSWVSAP